VTEHGLHEILERSKALGFLGPGDIDDHIRHARGFAELVVGEVDVLDLGSGGGLPGLVVAATSPALRLTLLDASERRAAFLRDAIRQLGWAERLTVELGRAEELARAPRLRERFPVVMARSFGAPAVTAECAAAFLQLDGRLLVSEPAASDDRWPAEGLAPLGLVPVALHVLEHTTVREMRRTKVGIDAVPRRVGVPARRPLF